MKDIPIRMGEKVARKLDRLKLIKKNFDLLFPWKIARGVSTFKTIFFIEWMGETLGETAFNVRFGESESQVEEKFAELLRQATFADAWEGLEELHFPISLPNSLQAGLAAAHLAKNAKAAGKTQEQLLSLPEPVAVATSFSVPILELSEIGAFFEKYSLSRFSVIKLKLGKEHDALKLLAEVAKFHPGPFRLDFNEARVDVPSFIAELKSIQRFPVEMVEQPFFSDQAQKYRELKNHSPFPVFIDETVTGQLPDESLAQLCHGINFKLMKSGGPYKLKHQLRLAHELGLKTMLGCMVETSLGISQALLFSSVVERFDLDGFLFLKQEPFLKVIERQGRIYLNRGHQA